MTLLDPFVSQVVSLAIMLQQTVPLADRRE
jgi:hypothetical protein